MTDWTPEMVAKLRELTSDGYSTTEIARRMGLTKGQVTGKAHRLRLTDQGMPVPRGGQKRGAAAVAEAAARAAAPRVVLPKAQSVGKSEQVVAHAVALAAGLGAERSIAPTPAIARTVQELAARVRASAMPRVAPMRAAEGCRYPLWGEERRPALRRFCDQPRRTGPAPLLRPAPPHRPRWRAEQRLLPGLPRSDACGARSATAGGQAAAMVRRLGLRAGGGPMIALGLLLAVTGAAFVALIIAHGRAAAEEMRR